MDNTSSKYLRLLMILLGGFMGTVLLLVILFFIFKFTSAALIQLPGFQGFYRYVVSVIPYLIFLGAYYYLRRKIVTSQHKTTRTIAILFLIAGILVCFASFTLVNLTLFGQQKDWLMTFNDNSQYFLILQLLLVFLSAASLAMGDPEEKDWLDKSKSAEGD